MATASSQKAICSLVEDGTLNLENKTRNPDYRGIVVSADKLIVVDYNARNLQLHRRHDGKCLATPHILESRPCGVCLISNKEVAVIMVDCTILILSFESTDRIKWVKTLDVTRRFDYCFAVAKVESMDKLVVSGRKRYIMYWCVVSLTDGHVDTIHQICKGDVICSHLVTNKNMVYISCSAGNKSPVNGVYAYDIFNPDTQKFLYQHRLQSSPCGLIVDARGFIFVCFLFDNSIHQLTDIGELVTIHTVSSIPEHIFYEIKQGVLYTTSWYSNEITRYRLEYPPGVPIEILNMDDRSIQLFEEALKDGKETVYSIRIMVVGHLGVGKTTLVKRLLGEEVNIAERRSTEGIDVYVNCCDVSLSTRKWTRRKKDSEEDYKLQRLVKVLNENYQTRDRVADQEQVASYPQRKRTKSNHIGLEADYDMNADELNHHSTQQDLGQNLASTARLQEESPSTVVQRNNTQSETNTMLGSELRENIASSIRQEESPCTVVQTNLTQSETSTMPGSELGENIATASLQEESSSTVVQSNFTQSETNTMPGTVLGEIIATESHKTDPLREMLKLLQENPDKVKQDVSKYAHLTIWDFAGQYAFYTTHQMFLTRRAIYLLVSDVSGEVSDLVEDECYFDTEGIMKCKAHELVEIWLNSIHSCALPDKEKVNSAYSHTLPYKVIPPPVILVGTHVDQIPQDYCRERGQIYLKEIRSHLRDKPTIVHFTDEDFAIDNTVVDIKLEELKRKIVKVASQQPYWGEEIPTRWFLLEQQLMKLRDAGVKVIARSTVESLNKEGTVQIKENEELDLFFKYLHETGTIIYFSIEVLRENIVLDPKWLIDALKLLINAHTILPDSPADNGSQSCNPTDSDADSAVIQKWSDFKEKGILTLELVDAVWTKEKYPELHAHKDHILLIMEQLNIIAKPRTFSEIGKKEENYFLTPCMLRQESPKEVISPEQDHQMVSTPLLRCVFTGKYLPPPIFHRLLAACVAHWPVAKKKDTSENLIFCGCCVFDLDLFHRLTLIFKNHVVSARITRMAIDEVKTPDAKLCSRVRRFITLNLSKITSYLGQNLQYELHVSPPFQMWLADEGHDHDAPITPEHMNHARLCVALVTVCGNALREILLAYFPVPYTDIYQAILANKVSLTKRQGRPLLNPDQSQLVFPDPQGQRTGTVDQFDLSLLYTLIRNISTVPAPVTGWGNDPKDQPRDSSLGASVERLRSYRNNISGHSPDGKISRQDLEDYWNKFEAVLHDIEAVIARQVYTLELEKHKRQVINIYEAC